MKLGTKIVVAILTLLISITGIVTADPQPGAVFATDSTGNRDANLFPTMEIYITGIQLVGGSDFEWAIYDMAPTVPCINYGPEIGCGLLVNSGTGGHVNTDGTIDPPKDSGWIIPNGDYAGHPYKLAVTIGPTDQKLHPAPALFYTKIDSFEPVPELKTMGLMSVGIIGLVLLVKRYKK